MGERVELELIGSGAAMRELREAVALAASASCHVLITGETGVGKGLVARSIHARSARAAHSFHVLDCAALSESLAEAELFGHERGAFTGALAARTGRLEAAGAGTLFLDEVGELPASLQPKLLRVLEEGEIVRLGGASVRRIAARIIAATHRPLASEVEAGRFRRDLYHRLRVFEIAVPPLRRHLEDLPELARGLLRVLETRVGLPPPTLTEDFLARLRSHAWPGNVRELRHVLEAAWLRRAGRPLRAADAECWLRPALSFPLPGARGRPGESVVGMDRERVAAALARAGGNVTRAAHVLGLSRSALRRRIERYGLHALTSAGRLRAGAR